MKTTKDFKTQITALLITVLVITLAVVIIKGPKCVKDTDLIPQDSLDVWIELYNQELNTNIANETLIEKQSGKIAEYDVFMNIALYGTRSQKKEVEKMYLDMSIFKEDRN